VDNLEEIFFSALIKGSATFEDKRSNKIETVQHLKKTLFYKLFLGFQGQTKNTCNILNFKKMSKSRDPSVQLVKKSSTEPAGGPGP